MAPKIQHKRSAVAGKQPLPTDLEYGEIAVNYEATDPALYIKDSANAVRKIGNQPDATATVKGIDTQKWSRTGTVLSPATAGDQVHTATGKLTVGGTAAAPSIEIKADGGIVANTDGLVYDAATKRLAIGDNAPGATGVDTGATQLFVVAPNSNFGPTATFVTDASGRGIVVCDQAKANSFSLTINSTVGALGTSASNIPLAFITGGREKARISGLGQLLIGTSTVLNASTAKLQCATTANIATTVYADNTAAKAGGLVAGDIYRKADGTLMITF